MHDITVNDLNIEEDMLNTTFMILQDLLSRIRQTKWEDVEVYVDVPITCRPYVEGMNNNVAGWASEVTFEVKNPFNNCDAAFVA